MSTCGDCKSFEPKQLVGICSLSQGVTRSTWHCTAAFEPGPKPLVEELAEALRAIRGDVGAQFQYFEMCGLNPPKTRGGAVMAHEDCELAGDCQTDARYTYPNRRALVAAVVDAALARYEKEQADDQQ